MTGSLNVIVTSNDPASVSAEGASIDTVGCTASMDNVCSSAALLLPAASCTAPARIEILASPSPLGESASCQRGAAWSIGRFSVRPASPLTVLKLTSSASKPVMDVTSLNNTSTEKFSNWTFVAAFEFTVNDIVGAVLSIIMESKNCAFPSPSPFCAAFSPILRFRVPSKSGSVLTSTV